MTGMAPHPRSEDWPYGDDDLESGDYPLDPPAHLDPDGPSTDDSEY